MVCGAPVSGCTVGEPGGPVDAGHAAAIESTRERRRESGPSVPQLSQEGAELARQRVVCADCWDAPDEWRG